MSEEKLTADRLAKVYVKIRDKRRELAEGDVNQRFGLPSPSRATEQFWDHMHRCTPPTSRNESHIFS